VLIKEASDLAHHQYGTHSIQHIAGYATVEIRDQLASALKASLGSLLLNRSGFTIVDRLVHSSEVACGLLYENLTAYVH